MGRVINKLRIWRNNSGKSGFTLVEVIVTLIITVIVVAVSSSLIITGTNIFARSAQRDIQTNIAETVLGFVSEQLLYSESIADFGSNPPVFTNAGDAAILLIKKSDSETMSDTRGQLFFRRAKDTQTPVNVFGSNFYNNYEVGLNIVIASSPSGYSMTLTVSVYNSTGREVLSRAATRTLLNYPGPPKSFPGAGEGFSIYYIPRVLS